jgi:hypothetical protein
MAKPYAIYFKKMKNDALVVDTLDNWGIVCKEFPFKLYGEAKELPSHDWKDEDGGDEYVPEVIPMAAYEMDVEFVYKGAKETANQKVGGFLKYLTGRDGMGAEMMVYDTYTGIGRQRVRFVKVDEDIFWRQEEGGDVLTFVVTLKVNDPVTDIKLSKA